LSAQRFDDRQRIFHALPCLCQIAALAIEPCEAALGRCFEFAILHFPA
jgi:hypothetical protein